MANRKSRNPNRQAAPTPAAPPPVSTPPSRPSAPKSPWKKRFIWLAVLFLAYTIIGFLIVPAIVKSQLLTRLPILTKRTAAVREVQCNPYTLSMTIRGLALTETNNEPFAGFEELYVNFELSSIFRGAWVFDEISLKQPFAAAKREASGAFNFDNLIATNSTPAPSSAKKPIPSIVIEHLNIEGAALTVADLSRAEPFQSKIAPINLHLTGFTTRPNVDDPYSFEATTDSGESFAWKGSITVEPLLSSGHFKIGQLTLKKYSPYLTDFTTAQLEDGKLDIIADYKLAIGTNGLDLTMSKGQVQLSNLLVKSPSTMETVVSIPSLTVDLTEASLAKKTVQISAIKSANGSILARQNSDGTINLFALLKQKPTAETKPAATNAAPWIANVEEISFTNYTVVFEDKKPAQPANLKLDQIAFDCKNFTTVSNATITPTVSMRLNEAGNLTVRGSGKLSPLSADVAIDLAGLNLQPFQPYVQEQAKLAITSGQLNVRGYARYAPDSKSPLISFTGEIGVTNLATTDLVQFKDFVKLNGLQVTGINLEMQPDKLDIQEIKLNGLSTTVAVDTNKQPNLLSILPPKNTNAPVASAPARAIPIHLVILTMENCSFHLADASIEPNCLFDVQEFGGTITGLSTDTNSTATLDLKGKVDAASPFSVSGKINPLSRDLLVDLAISMKNMDLTPFTPYMEKFGGYPLNKGKLLLDLHYDIQHRALKAENKVAINLLTLGGRNASTNATHLPVKLAIALLKDRNGKIDLDVPLNGRLDDPKFRVGPIVLQVVMNLLAKAATSPFSLLGAMFGGGEELSYVDFPPGQFDIPLTETNKLDKLSKALFERPALSLEITGSADRAADAPFLASAKLNNQIVSLRTKELIAAGQATDKVQVAPADYTRLLKQLFFATITNQAAPKPVTNIVVATNIPVVTITNTPATPKTGWFTRSIGKIENFLTPASEKQAEQAALAKKSVLATGTNTLIVAAVPATVAAPMPEGQVTVEQMVATLTANAPVTDNDLRELMQNRAKSVQAALLTTGKVTADRLFLLAPKPTATTNGQPRVNLTLE